MSEIKPTIGRVVLYRPHDFDENVRFAALVADVNDDGTVNLCTFNMYGVSEPQQNVTLVQGNDVPEPGQCEWMAYQKGQAARNDELEQMMVESAAPGPAPGGKSSAMDSADGTMADSQDGAEGSATADWRSNIEITPIDDAFVDLAKDFCLQKTVGISSEGLQIPESDPEKPCILELSLASKDGGDTGMTMYVDYDAFNDAGVAFAIAGLDIDQQEAVQTA